MTSSKLALRAYCPNILYCGSQAVCKLICGQRQFFRRSRLICYTITTLCSRDSGWQVFHRTPVVCSNWIIFAMFLQFAILLLFIITTTGEADGRKLVGSAATNERHINFIGKITGKIMISWIKLNLGSSTQYFIYLSELTLTSLISVQFLITCR